MQKRKQVSKIIFRGLMGIFVAGLLVVGGAVFYTHHFSNQSLDKLLPSDVDYVIELQPDELAQNIIRQKWGEQGAKVAYGNGP